MRVLIACEYSGTVRDAFIAQGHDAMSCDLLPSDRPGPHYQGDIVDILGDDWDLMVAHPPCTHLAVSGAKHFKEKQADGRQTAALEFVRMLMDAPIPRICVENPVSIISTKIRKPDQIIQPWQFGHEATKTTCLWLKGLPPLVPTNIVGKGARHVTKSGKSLPQWYNLPPSADRWKIRSATFQGIADAMAAQWSEDKVTVTVTPIALGWLVRVRGDHQATLGGQNLFTNEADALAYARRIAC
jgi:hypothetical protein